MNNVIESEINELISLYKDYLVSDGMKASFSLSFFSHDKNDWLNDHEYLHEFFKYLQSGREVNLPSLPILDDVFVTLEKGSVIYPEELLTIRGLLNSSIYLADLFSNEKELYHLNDDVFELNPLFNLKREIETDIEDDFSISSKASVKLREIRDQKREIISSLSTQMSLAKSKYSAYLSENLITIKGGEEALPVKASSQKHVKGTIVAYSATKETVYMVPYEVIDLRNKLKTLEEEESAEILKILADLSDKCRKQLKFLRKDYEIYLRFDRYLGAVRFGQSYQGTIAEESKDTIVLKSLFHPLLKSSNVVTNSVELGGKEPAVLLISGPNAGGKSVLIKALALSYLMDRLGLFVPTKGEAKLPFIDELFFLGGDNQSVADNLSTFSSHLLSLKETTEKATSNSLVIIDEIGEGTSPKDGEALSVGVLNYFLKLNCFTIITSHYDGLKMYAASKEDVLSGAMEYDIENMKPTYRLLLHTTGKSYGLLLATNLGLNQTILNDAKAYQKEQSSIDVEALLEKLAKQQAQNEQRAKELELQRERLEKAIAKRESAIDALAKEKEAIHKKAQAQVERIVDQKLDEINQVWNSQTKGNLKFNEVAEAKGKLKRIASSSQSNSVEKKCEILNIEVGDTVIDEEGRRGVVLEIKKNEVRLDLDGLKFTRSKVGLKRAVKTVAELKKEGKIKESTLTFDRVILAANRGIELNIIGLHVEEAMREVEVFIDNAIARGAKSLRIIHGAGTFALKNALWDYLKNHPKFIKDYRLGGENEGGLGATIVHLR